MRKSLAAAVIAVSVAAVPACATKGFVREEVGGVNSKVDTLGGTVEQTQERVGRNEERIGAVDQKAEAAGRAASDARTAAGEARTVFAAQQGMQGAPIGRPQCALPRGSNTLRSAFVRRPERRHRLRRHIPARCGSIEPERGCLCRNALPTIQ